MEIDVDSDTVLSNEESKFDEADKQEAVDYNSLPTKVLFKKVQLILNIINERLMAKDASLRSKLTDSMRNPEVTQEFHARPAYYSQGGNHLAMGRVLDFNQVGRSKSGQILQTFQFTTKDKIEPST